MLLIVEAKQSTEMNAGIVLRGSNEGMEYNLILTVTRTTFRYTYVHSVEKATIKLKTFHFVSNKSANAKYPVVCILTIHGYF